MIVPGRPLDEINTDNWRLRRRALFIALFWMGDAMTYILVHGVDSALNSQAFIAMAGATTSLLCAYIFGAVWDDHNRRMSDIADAYTAIAQPPGMPPPPASTTTTTTTLTAPTLVGAEPIIHHHVPPSTN